MHNLEQLKRKVRIDTYGYDPIERCEEIENKIFSCLDALKKEPITEELRTELKKLADNFESGIKNIESGIL